MNCSNLFIFKFYCIACTQSCFLLRETIIVTSLFFTCSLLPVNVNPASASFSSNKFFISQILQAKHFPPKRFLFSPVPVKHVCQQPFRLLFSSAVFFFNWNIPGQVHQTMAEFVVDDLLYFLPVLSSSAAGRGISFPCVYQFFSSCFQPVTQPFG